MTADTPERQRELIEAALDAMTEPPVTPLPFAAPAPTPRDADEWAEHLDLQINCWEETFRELSDACAATGVAADYLRYRTLTQALDWAYAVDSSLTALWRMLPDHQREQASAETDERARKAAEHNASGQLPFDVETDLAFAGYVRRLKDHQPYEHWGELLLAGVFQGSFFEAVAWVRGQLIHAATSAPLDLRQYQAGVEPRWKWRESDLFARGRPNDVGRRLYDRVLAGRDVLGLLGHLSQVFSHAQRELVRCKRLSEGAP